VAIDNFSEQEARDANSNTLSFSVGALPDGILLVAIAYESAYDITEPEILSVEWNGLAMTQIASISNVGATSSVTVRLYYFDLPVDNNTYDVVASFTANTHSLIGAISLKNMDRGFIPRIFTATGSSAHPTVTTTPLGTGITSIQLAMYAGTSDAGAFIDAVDGSNTQLWGGGIISGGTADPLACGGVYDDLFGTSLGATLLASDDWVIAAVELAAGPTVPNSLACLGTSENR